MSLLSAGLSHAQTETPSQSESAPQGVVPPELLTKSEIPYPDDQSQDAVVTLKLLISEDGSVGEVTVLDGEQPFAGIAQEEVKTWTFSPARVNGTPKAAYIRFTVDFVAPQEPAPTAPVPTATEPTAADAIEEELEIKVVGKRVPGTTHVMSDAETYIIPGAEGDPLRAIEAMPGTVPILSSGPFIGIRGSSPAMVGYNYDGITVPYLFHLARGSAVVNPWLVSSASIYATGGPARLGQAVAGTIEAQAAEPEHRYRAYARLRITDSSVGVEAPFASGKGNVMAAGRYSYTKPMVSLIAPEFSLNYWDYQLRARYAITEHDTIELLTFGAGDKSAIELDDGSYDDLMNGSFHRASLRYTHHGNQGAKQRLSLTYGHDRWDARPELIRPRSHSLALRFEADSPVVDSAGARVASIGYGTEVSARQQKDDFYNDPPLETVETIHRTDLSAAAWLDGTLYASARTALDLGVRADLFTSGWSPITDQAVGWSLTPRFALSHQVTPILRLHTSFGINSQLKTPAQRPPGRLLTPKGGLEYSALSDIGADLALPAGLSATAAVFNNAYFNVMDAENLLYIQEQVRDARAQGQSYGFELALKRMVAKHLRGFIAYTQSYSYRSIGRVRSAAPYDRRHVIDAALAYDFGKGWSVSSRATYYTGFQARMQSVSALQDPPRSNPYFQLDLQGAKRFNIDEHGRYWAITCGILNATLSLDTNDYDCSSGNCYQEQVGPATVPTIGIEGEL